VAFGGQFPGFYLHQSGWSKIKFLQEILGPKSKNTFITERFGLVSKPEEDPISVLRSAEITTTRFRLSHKTCLSTDNPHITFLFGVTEALTAANFFTHFV
jgi:hypothetical protein